MIKNKIFSFIVGFVILLVANSMFAQTGSNPIFRDMFTADPAPMVYNGRLYVYVGHDEAYNGEMFKMTEWLCYSTTDMINWTAHGKVMRPEDFKWNKNDPNAVKEAWASQCVYRNGKFYLYVTATYNGRNIGVGVSDSPTGPFVDARGTALITDGMTNNGDAWDDIDPTVLIDDDGTAYLSWGNPNCYLAKLKPNMTEIDGAITMITPPNYGEGPWLSKRNGLYYLTYAAFPVAGGSEQICYATATNIYGPWTYRGILTGSASGSYTIHPGIVNYKGNDYLFYHFAAFSIGGYTGTLGRRSVCVDYLCYNADGTMKPVKQTLAGVTVTPPCPSAPVPVVSITAPLNNAVFTAPATIAIAATATITSGTISKVEFYNGTTKLGEDVTSPYSYNWTNVAAGTYSITAVATDNANVKTTSSAVTLKVNVPQGPYQGTAWPIPGTIQFENFDVGGNGVAYLDNAATNTGGATFRTDEDVDIENCTDTNTGYNIGYATIGEWLEYTVNVTSAGTYDMDLRVACNGDGRTMSVSMDGTNIATNVAIPNTAGWQTWQTVKVSNIALTAGQKVMRVTIGATDYINLNYVTFTALKQTPYTTAHVIPGRIEAEHYDLGGEGLAYHEANTNGNEGLATLRTDEVDVETTQDTDGAYNIAYILQDEWLEYTVNVQTAGEYDIALRFAADGDGKTMHIEMDGVNISGAVAVPNTVGWQVWQTVMVNEIALTAGEHIMRIAFDASYMNLNYVEFTKSTTTNINQTETTKGFIIYPNPVKDFIEVKGERVKGKVNDQIVITNALGQVIMQTPFNPSTLQPINISTLSPGLYFIKIGSSVQKFYKINE